RVGRGDYRISSREGLTEIEVERAAANKSADAAWRINVEPVAGRNRPTRVDFAISDHGVAPFWRRVSRVHLIDYTRTGIFSDIDHESFPSKIGLFAIVAMQWRAGHHQQYRRDCGQCDFAPCGHAVFPGTRGSSCLTIFFHFTFLPKHQRV